MGIWESMQAAASPAWEFGNPCRRQGHPHGNLEIHAGVVVSRMGIWKSMQTAVSAAWKFQILCRWRHHPHGEDREFRYISRQTAGQNGKICRSPNKFE